MVRLEAEFGKPVVTNKISTVWHIRTTVKQLTTQTRIRSFDDGKQMRLQSLD
jgi:maleate cis-trans isomerase